MPGTTRTRSPLRPALWGGVCVLLAAALVCYALQRARPGWWDERERVGAETSERAEAIENAVASELSRVRPGAAGEPYRSEEWALRLDETDISAWLLHRLGPWAMSRFETGIPDIPLRVRVREGAVVVGALAGSGRVVSVELAPRVDASGEVWLDVRGVRVGKLAVPRGLVLDGAWASAGGSGPARRVFEALGGRRPLGRAVVRVDAARQARVLDIRCGEGVLEVRLVTEARPE